MIRLIRSLAHFFYSRALGIGHGEEAEAQGEGCRGEEFSPCPLLPHLPRPHLFTTAGTDTCVRNCLVCSIIWSMSSWDKRWT